MGRRWKRGKGRRGGGCKAAAASMGCSKQAAASPASTRSPPYRFSSCVPPRRHVEKSLARGGQPLLRGEQPGPRAAAGGSDDGPRLGERPPRAALRAKGVSEDLARPAARRNSGHGEGGRGGSWTTSASCSTRPSTTSAPAPHSSSAGPGPVPPPRRVASDGLPAGAARAPPPAHGRLRLRADGRSASACWRGSAGPGPYTTKPYRLCWAWALPVVSKPAGAPCRPAGRIARRPSAWACTLAVCGPAGYARYQTASGMQPPDPARAGTRAGTRAISPALGQARC